ncbi:MAG: MBL fold metallo-hydrolase [Planctomycetes bacterium]|nr:MBL fold metallo-hydrolase [Planctomycetota bacterium]MCB9885496.1 MBL fold metallo-hydrolase [Planctomycetota bacterium]
MLPIHTRRGLAIALLASLAPLAAQDAERQTHSDDASKPQVSFQVTEPSHQLLQYQLGCLSLLSYVVVSDGQAAVIDPQRDVDQYLDAIAARGAKLRYVVLTHPHADFVAGHTELAQRTGAEILISAKAGAKFAHHAMQDGELVQLGKVQLQMWDTPGHTPNAATFLLQVQGEAGPRYAFTGDTLFIGGIGRPDLLDVPPAELAAQSFTSIQRLKTLPDSTLVLPAHGAGSLCGAHLSAATTSTIGEEKATNPYLLLNSRASFIAKVLSHQPVAPQYFAFNVALNLQGPPLVDRGADLPPRADLAAVKPDAWIVDLRNQTHYSEAHIRGAINVALRGRLDTWTGIVVPFDAPVLLVGSEAEVREGTFRLRRIGFDHLAGWLGDDVDAWRKAGLPVVTSSLIEPKDLYAKMQKGEEPIVIDVRTADEYEDVRIGEIGNIAVTDSARFGKVLAKDQPVVMLCNSAYRSSMAVGLAERQGFTAVGSLDGGLDAWLSAGLPTIGRLAQGAAIRLPQVVTAEAVANAAAGQWTLFDVRAAWQWNDWHVPGAVNVALDELVDTATAAPAGAKIVLLSKDGDQAFAAAGALLAEHPGLDVYVLRGGVAAYYRDVVLRAASSLPGSAPAMPSPTPATTNNPVIKKRSVGC